MHLSPHELLSECVTTLSFNVRLHATIYVSVLTHAQTKRWILFKTLSKAFLVEKEGFGGGLPSENRYEAVMERIATFIE